MTQGELTLRNRENVPVQVAEMVANRAEAEFAVVRAFLAQADTYAGAPYSAPLEIVIDPEQAMPCQRALTIRLPETRVPNRDQVHRDTGHRSL